jgi:hypothetical protein
VALSLGGCASVPHSAGLKASLRQLQRERRKLAEGDDDNFNIFDTQQLAETLSRTTGVLTTLLGAARRADGSDRSAAGRVGRSAARPG